MKTTTKPFDPAEYLTDGETMAAYIDEALATGDAAYVAKCLGDVARAHGMTQVAATANATRPSLYKALSQDGNPGLGTVMRVLQTMGLKLNVAPSQDRAKA